MGKTTDTYWHPPVPRLPRCYGNPSPQIAKWHMYRNVLDGINLLLSRLIASRHIRGSGEQSTELECNWGLGIGDVSYHICMHSWVATMATEIVGQCWAEFPLWGCPTTTAVSGKVAFDWTLPIPTLRTQIEFKAQVWCFPISKYSIYSIYISTCSPFFHIFPSLTDGTPTDSRTAPRHWSIQERMALRTRLTE